ncbi:DUF4396 domain-containing protein, partial [Corallococcus sp. 4LFB]|uniref:DUF4396 domain-containing protein n=1 Tax=Corallococcus sp. 4LFB TaxID=3383249 RepID=UPI003975D9DB
MDLGFLSFLAEPGFVLPWYAVGLLGAGWVVHDTRRVNTQVKPVMKWAWPLIVLFLSVFGLAVYLWSSRPPAAGARQGHAARDAYDAYAETMPRRVMGSVIHCVAGDGLGIITAMVAARLLGLSFWQEFWFEYAVGFAFGWFIFQYKAMRGMADSALQALWMGGRAEFFSMMTVMAGMGAVMAWVTPLVVGQQPRPDTWAFWGFAMLGLLVGFVATYPMNWALVRLGWKHGLGHHPPPTSRGNGQGGLAWRVAVMATAGVAALAVPGVLFEVHEGRPLALASSALPEGSGG